MATADTVLTTVYFRLRDTSRVATPVASGLLFLSHIQRALNLYLRFHVTKATLSTEANRTIYDITEPSGTDIARVDLVQDGTTDLPHLPLSQLWTYDPNWLRGTGTPFRSWTRLGRRLVAICPAKTGASSVKLVGPTQLALLSTISDALSVKDEWITVLEDLTEALFCLRLRLFPQGTAALKRAVEMLGIGDDTIRNSALFSQGGEEGRVGGEKGRALGEQPDSAFKQLARDLLGPRGLIGH